MTFQKKLLKIQKKNNSLVCVGLDSDLEKIPQHLQKNNNPIFEFNKAIIKATHNLVCAYKPNIAFYEAEGEKGLKSLKKTMDYLHKNHPEIPIILDAKRGDIDNTNLGYIKLIFDYLGVDAVTLHPYLGKESLLPFLALKTKFFFILCRTSNPGAGEFQDLRVKGQKLYQYVAHQVVKKWNFNKNVGLVVGATYPQELKEIRDMVKKMPLLVPGVGSQGGDIQKTVEAAEGGLFLVNSSRSIIFASQGKDFAKAAREQTLLLKNTINQFRKTKINEKVAWAIMKANLVKFGLFTYTSGRKGPIYIDLRKLPSYPKLFDDVTEELSKVVKTLSCDVVAGSESAGIPLSTAVSMKTGIPMIYVRKEPKDHGTGSQVEGVLKKDQRVIVVDDLITYGTSKMNFIEGIEKGGGIVKDVVIVLDGGRKTGGRELLEGKGYNLHALLTFKELLEYMVKKRKLTKKLQESTIRYLDDPDKWEKNLEKKR